MLISYNADLLPKVRMLGQIRYNEPWIHFSRCLGEWVLYVIRDGNLYLQEDGVRYHLRAGDFFLLEPGLPHEGYQKAVCDPTAPETCLPKQFHLAGGEFKAQLHAAVECYDSREDDYKRRASALLHSFLLQTAHEHLLAKNSAQGRKIRKSDVIAEQLLRYLNQNYAKHLTSREIEELFEGNFDYLNRVFSSLTGSPVFAYLNILRINNAKQLISTTDLPFSEIAYLVGIEDRYYFSKLFRKMTGMSPTEYYKEVRS